ncbi:hypothetical protein RFI_23507 [Reticulomyxa filosa]|uniref:Uncharacterized protein n=1 Tax=Reticulomyxa filosa TaxID=46433 RepID=X6MIQ1_RETFI|nr:hypothetical protein RFI_23507 [Reticulomyxa filosa]|eukprot:ETO13863.1 hypothetical protein RFI_23507 [Reticulomyxa filosa]
MYIYKKIFEENGVPLVKVENENEIVDPYSPRTMYPPETMIHLKKLWETEKPIMERLFCVPNINSAFLNPKPLIQCNYKQFFIKTLIVTPNRYRPSNYVSGRTIEHSRNSCYRIALRFLLLSQSIKKHVKDSNQITQNPLIQRYQQYVYQLEKDAVKEENKDPDSSDSENEKVEMTEQEVRKAEALLKSQQTYNMIVANELEQLQIAVNKLCDSTKGGLTFGSLLSIFIFIFLFLLLHYFIIYL